MNKYLENKTMNTHIMCDIETLASETSNAVITSIAMVEFDILSGKILDSIVVNVDIQSCLNLGMELEGETLKWWLTEGGIKTLETLLVDTKTINEALYLIRVWLDSKTQSSMEIWGNSNRFDLGILSSAYRKAFGKKAKLPWQFRLERDVRTVMGLLDTIKASSSETIIIPDFKQNAFTKATVEGKNLHDPLNDCEIQVKYLTDAIRFIRLNIQDNYNNDW